MADTFDRNRLRSVHLVPLAPFDASNRLNRELLAEHIARMRSAGIHIYLPAAGTSEFHSLSADEVVEFVRVTREASGPDAVVFAPVGLQVGHAVDMAVRSLQAGATGIMFMPWVHPYLSDAGIRDYCQAVIDRAQCPALIYKNAALPSDALLLELADNPHVVGVKYATGDMHAFRKVVLADSGRIEWLCGTAERFAPYYMLVGASGFTSASGNLCPHLSLAMHAALTAGEYQEGLRLQQLLLPIEEYRSRDGDSYSVSMLKHAMTLLGQDFGPPRPPQRRLTSAERAEIEALMEPILAAETQMRSELASVGLSKG